MRYTKLKILSDWLKKSGFSRESIYIKKIARLTDIVWHATHYRNAIDILEQDRFLTSSALRTFEGNKYDYEEEYADEYDYLEFDDVDFESDYESNPKSKKYHYFLSTMRSPLSDFKRDVTFKLDGRKLNQRYSGGPIHFFQEQTDDEMEDRVYTNEPYIENASQYILEVRMLASEINQGGYVNRVSKLCEEKNIPYGIWFTRREYEMGAEDYKYSYSDWSQAFGNDTLTHSWYDSLDTGGVSRKLKALAFLINFINKGPSERFPSNNVEDVLKLFISDPTPIVALEIMHEIQEAGKTEENTRSIQAISSMMRRNKLKSIESLIDFIKDKLL